MTGSWRTGIWESHEPTSCQQYSCHESLAESNRWLRGGKAGTLTARKWDLFPRIFLPSIFLPDFPLCRFLRSIHEHEHRSLFGVFHDVLKFSCGSLWFFELGGNLRHGFQETQQETALHVTTRIRSSFGLTNHQACGYVPAENENTYAR